MIHYMSPIGLGAPWVGNELREVERAGVPFTLHALRNPAEIHFTSEWARRLHRETRSVYPLPPLGFALSVALAPFLFGSRFFASLWNALTGERESLRARAAALWHLFVAAHWARSLRHEKVSHIHSQWIHSGGTVAWCAARMLGVPFSFTGHAADLYRNAVALNDKVRDAAFIGCISEFHKNLFREKGAREEQLQIAYCGIDVSHFTPRLRERRPGERVRILSSGRLVEKKGFEYLIDAVALLRAGGTDVECVVGGSGPLERDLRERAAKAGVADLVTVTGKGIAQEELPAFMAQGDIYCLACVWASDDDVDGLPQMLMEAMACGLPAVSTRLVGIPDLIIHEETGLLVEQRQARELADALARLIGDDALRRRLAEGGRRIVEEKFDILTTLDGLIDRYRRRLGMPVPARPAPSARAAGARASAQGAVA